MEKFIPYEKLSKKEKRKIDQARRQTWGELNPVTRKPTNSKAYNRKKSQNWKRELPPTDLRLFFCYMPPSLKISLCAKYETINLSSVSLTSSTFPL